MKQLVWIFVICWILEHSASASPPKAVMSDLAGVPFGRTMTSVSELPRRLKSALARTFLQKTLYLGNPDEPIGAEVITAGMPQNPDRRLIFAFETSAHYIVYVEYGPPAVHASALVFEKAKAGSLPFVWGGVDLRMPPFAKTPLELAKRIRGGKLRDERVFIW